MAMTANIPVPLNPAQLELLQLFAGGLDEEQMAELRRILLDFKFRRVTALADQYADEKGWSSDDIARDAASTQRRPYQRTKKKVTPNG